LGGVETGSSSRRAKQVRKVWIKYQKNKKKRENSSTEGGIVVVGLMEGKNVTGRTSTSLGS